MLHELNAFLDISDPALFQLSSHVQSLLIPHLDQKILTSVHNIKFCIHTEDHRHTLYQMEKEIHLAVIITQKDLAAYCEHKNIDSATLLLKLYTAFLNVFFRKEADTLPKHGPYDHAIHLKEGTQAPASALYSMSRDEALKLCQYLDENLSKEFIWVSHSDAAASVLFMKKSEEGLCFCVDYWGLNVISVKNWYLLPLISETLNYLCYDMSYYMYNIDYDMSSDYARMLD